LDAIVEKLHIFWIRGCLGIISDPESICKSKKLHCWCSINSWPLSTWVCAVGHLNWMRHMKYVLLFEINNDKLKKVRLALLGSLIRIPAAYASRVPRQQSACAHQHIYIFTACHCARTECVSGVGRNHRPAHYSRCSGYYNTPERKREKRRAAAIKIHIERERGAATNPRGQGSFSKRWSHQVRAPCISRPSLGLFHFYKCVRRSERRSQRFLTALMAFLSSRLILSKWATNFSPHQLFKPELLWGEDKIRMTTHVQAMVSQFVSTVSGVSPILQQYIVLILFMLYQNKG
jgi:hypothetical protein